VVSFALTLMVGGSVAQAHLTSYPNSVDSSTSPAQIRYSTNSKYTGAVNNAIDRWNAESRVEIKPDAWNTVKDLEIGDQYSSDTWHGKFVWNPGADNITFNTRILDGSTWEYEHRAKTALHEFGHSLDFAHNELAWPTSIMRQGKRFQDYLGSHDKADDDARWTQ
jgi:hypothetical protein